MDIFKLTKSKARQKILQLFFADPDKRYYLRELERILSLPVGNIRRELVSLAEAGLFAREKAGNQVYYFLNKKSFVFEELKKIVSKTIGLEARLRENLRKIAGIRTAFVFGSFAGGKEDSFSDIDLMIIGRIDESALLSKISSLEKELRREINYNIFSPEDFKKGLAQKEVFLEEIIAKPKVFIVGGQDDLENIVKR
ncbi:MAG: transcriptional regulator [Candidatus Portnoybacteria bacterium CG09_land_8_20_14_0_10_44_13]|uniref:Transcriptional regulator n=4 Tax=Candidatus Portnoyibacteriota TaxID=1817913 RepID=A0A2H0KRJ5_9BACT|nr:MAG: transcriptional regulator [Candidatus Portnoybacteria bacterium CG11_big_fil_rev_8_21_14_0_20_44_10]PIS16155.1 MAG: transcriptional regulator [Candidatus Portnoybacteria bacterium CG09_land_8_20_14_0_10_44_13]PIZ70074.1 MAG: transcriptional regulator [Candidatus Portnoybacteria bacterium CG_4_10_14_0_2_um_filter_44_20]PJA63074.1 MAG: transcriptional regulator [Candidatus Portnoybacteria bacterium CG_4_9_14_3_um_filter_44_9]